MTTNNQLNSPGSALTAEGPGTETRINMLTSGLSRRRLDFPIATIVVLIVTVVIAVMSNGNNALGATVTSFAILLATAQAWNLLAGFAGLISLGVSAYLGVGSYTVAMLTTDLSWPWWAALLAVIPALLIIGYILSIPLLRLRADYFAIGSFAALLALQAIVSNVAFFGGSAGISMPTEGVPSPQTTTFLAIGVAVLSVITVLFISYSKFGLRLQASRDDESAAETLGVAVKRNYLLVYLIGAVLTGLAGGILALQNASATPDNSFAMTWTIGALLMATVGGIGTVIGPVLGVYVVYYLLQQQLENFAALSLLIEGVLLIVLIRVAPSGVWPLVKRLARWGYDRFRAWRGARSVRKALEIQKEA